MVVMPFGKYQGEPLSQCDRPYLEWLCLQDWFRWKFSGLFEKVKLYLDGRLNPNSRPCPEITICRARNGDLLLRFPCPCYSIFTKKSGYTRQLNDHCREHRKTKEGDTLASSARRFRQALAAPAL